MSKYFVQSKNENIKEIFNKKQLFKIVSKSDHKNLVDFTYGEKMLYGRVDRYFMPIIAHENRLKLKGLPSNGSLESNIKVFNFVADAFRDMQIKFKTKLARGELDPNDPNLSILKAVAGYRDPRIMHNNRTLNFSNAVGNIIFNNNLQFNNFNQFINVIMPYMKNLIKSGTITLPAFVKSTACPIHVSGLVIDIGKINPNNDKDKYENFYQSPNWDFFLNACKAYGFMVDSNMPNRIIADLNSPHMLEKMAAYDPQMSSADMFITNCYTPAGQGYFTDFKIMLYQIYSNNRKRRVSNHTHTFPDRTRTTEYKIKNYKYEDFVAEVSNRKIMEIYQTIRFLEEESKFSNYEKNIIIRDTYEIFKDNPDGAILVFEKILGKTFDYSGSLSYIEHRKKKLGL